MQQFKLWETSNWLFLSLVVASLCIENLFVILDVRVLSEVLSAFVVACLLMFVLIRIVERFVTERLFVRERFVCTRFGCVTFRLFNNSELNM
jgi:hypothetical protein